MQATIKPTSQTWDKVAENYLIEIQEVESQLGAEIGSLLRSFGVNPGARLLELGSGSGHLSAILAQQGFEVTLLDFSAAALQKSRECFRKHGLAGRLIEGDLTNLPAGLGEFDVVWNSGVMEHFDDENLRAAFTSIQKVNASHYLFIVPNPDSLPYLLFRHHEMTRNQWLWGWEALRRDYVGILETSGLRVEHRAYLGAKFAESQLCVALQTTEWPLARLIQLGVVAKSECYLVAFHACRTNEPGHHASAVQEPAIGVTAYQTEIFDLHAQVKWWQEQAKSPAQKAEAELAPLEQLQADLQRRQEWEQHVRSVAKTKPYRLAHFLRRLERDLFKGDRKERKEFAFWLWTRLRGRQLSEAEQKNPLLDDKKPVAVPDQGRGPAAARPPSHDYREQLAAILKAHPGKPIIVSRPLYDWNLPLLQRPQHLGRELAAAGFLYFFCTPNLRDRVDGFWEVSSGCYVTNQFDLLETLSKRITHLYAGDLTCDLHYVKQRRQAGDLILYEFIDELHKTLCGNIPGEAKQRHAALLADSDVVCIASADALLRAVHLHRTRNTALVTNGVEVEHFAPASEIEATPPDELRPLIGKGKPVVGYFGALASWFDYALVELVARERPQYEWLLVGWNFDGSLDRSNLRILPNVTVIGPIDYKVLPRYARCFDVSTIPFLVNDVTQSTSPIKLFEYMALGKPIVTTNLPECRKYRSPMIAKTPEEFLRLIDQAVELRRNGSGLGILREEALANSWATKARDLAALLRKNLGVYSNALLDEAQREIVECYRHDDPRTPSYYEKTYREAERNYWFPVLSWIDELPRPAGVADIGAAYGSLLLYTIKRFNPASRLAVDPVRIMSPTLVERQRIRYTNRDVERENVNDLGTFDLVLFTEVMEHLNYHPTPTLKKLRDLIRPGGHLVLTTPDASEWGRITRYFQSLEAIPPYVGQQTPWIDEHIWQYSAQEAEAAFAQAGLEVVRFAYARGNGARHLCYLLRPEGEPRLQSAVLGREG